MPEYKESVLSARGLRFALVVSRYNEFVTERLLEGALDALREGEVAKADIDLFRIPGAFEIPQMARRAAETGRYDGIVCLGALIRGETIHFELISRECARGIQEVAADLVLPVSFGVITADTVEQATARCGQKSENKGWEAARAAMEMALLYRKIGAEDEEMDENEV